MTNKRELFKVIKIKTGRENKSLSMIANFLYDKEDLAVLIKTGKFDYSRGRKKMKILNGPKEVGNEIANK